KQSTPINCAPDGQELSDADNRLEKRKLSQCNCAEQPNDDHRDSIRVAIRELKIDRQSSPDQGHARSKM
ncbi:hypothetical protein, partial [Sphingobium herbicidovorans]